MIPGNVRLTVTVADNSDPTRVDSSPQTAASMKCWRSEHHVPPEGGSLLISELGFNLLSSS